MLIPAASSGVVEEYGSVGCGLRIQMTPADFRPGRPMLTVTKLSGSYTGRSTYALRCAGVCTRNPATNLSASGNGAVNPGGSRLSATGLSRRSTMTSTNTPGFDSSSCATTR